MWTMLGSSHTNVGVLARLQKRLNILESLRLEGVIEVSAVVGAVCRLVTIKDEANREDMDGVSREMADDVFDRSEINSSTQYPSPWSKNSWSSEKDLDSQDLEVRMTVHASEQGHNLEGPSIVVMWAESDCVELLVELWVGEHT